MYTYIVYVHIRMETMLVKPPLVHNEEHHGIAKIDYHYTTMEKGALIYYNKILITLQKRMLWCLPYE